MTPTLAEVAQRLSTVNGELLATRELITELEAPLKVEQQKARDLEDERKRLTQALAVAKRAHFITQARDATGYESAADPVIIVPSRFGLPEVWELVAVAPDGTGLYKEQPEQVKTYRGKTRNARGSRGHAILSTLVPEAVRAVVAEDARRSAEVEQLYKATDYSSERTARVNRMRKERDDVRKAGFEEAGFDRHAEVQERGERITSWHARGTGDFGKGSGAYKPLAPPNGGRWRKLKVEEQRDLTAGEEG